MGDTSTVTEAPSVEHKAASFVCEARNNHLVRDGHPRPDPTLGRCVMPRDRSSPRTVDGDTLERLELPKTHEPAASRPPSLFPYSCRTGEKNSSHVELTPSGGNVALGTSELKCSVDQRQAALGNDCGAHTAGNIDGKQLKQGDDAMMPERQFTAGALVPPLRLKIPSLLLNKHGRIVAGERLHSKPGAENEGRQVSLHHSGKKAVNAAQSKLASLRTSLDDDEWIQVSWVQRDFLRCRNIFCDSEAQSNRNIYSDVRLRL